MTIFGGRGRRGVRGYLSFRRLLVFVAPSCLLLLYALV